MIYKEDIAFAWTMITLETLAIMIANNFTYIPGFMKVLLLVQGLVTIYQTAVYMKQERK